MIASTLIDVLGCYDSETEIVSVSVTKCTISAIGEPDTETLTITTKIASTEATE